MLDLSILVPVYNVQDYLERCVESLRNQTISNYEIVLVDDGSTDDSGKICDHFAHIDGCIRVIHQENRGLAGARITGIKNSRGRFIGFVDSDDYVDALMFEKLLAPVKKCTEIDISIGGHVVDEIDGSIKYPCSAKEVQIWDDGIQAMTEMFKGEKFVWSLCGKIYNRDLFFDSKCLEHWPHSHGEDTYINSVIMPKAKKIIFQPIYCYHYCMHISSMMHAEFNSAKLATVYIVADIMEKYKAYPNLVNALRNQLFSYLKSYLKEMQLAAPKYDEDFKKCKTIAKKWLIDGNDNIIQKEIMTILSLDYDDYKKWKISEKEHIKSFCCNNPAELYIYGTGVYGKMTAEYLTEHEMDFCGFIETNPHVESFMNHPVYKIDKIERKVNILLGLGEKNTITVKEKIVNSYPYVYCMYVFLSCIDSWEEVDKLL